MPNICPRPRQNGAVRFALSDYVIAARVVGEAKGDTHNGPPRLLPTLIAPADPWLGAFKVGQAILAEGQGLS